MDNNGFSELKIDATSFDDVSKLSTAINNKSYQISYDSIPDLINAITTNNLINNTITTSVSPYTYEDPTWTNTSAQPIYATYNYQPTSYKGVINKKDLSYFMRDISLVFLDAANGKDLKQVFETMSTYFAAYADALENNTKYEENETE